MLDCSVEDASVDCLVKGVSVEPRMTLSWLMFLQIVPLGIVTIYDLRTNGHGWIGYFSIRVLCSSVVTHTAVPGAIYQSSSSCLS